MEEVVPLVRDVSRKQRERGVLEDIKSGLGALGQPNPREWLRLEKEWVAAARHLSSWALGLRGADHGTRDAEDDAGDSRP
jgi:hypothetical protein